MSLSIPSSFPTASPSEASVPRTAVAASPAQPPAEDPPFVIKLTEAQQVYQLSLKDQTVPQIANQLSLTVAAVNNYLEINNSPNNST
jgi:hypothetical protein